MKKLSVWLISGVVAVLSLLPISALAAGISASGGGKYTTAQTFTISVVASGAEFDSLQGTISVAGPVSIVSFSAGGATWLPGKSPANGQTFVGITNPTKSLTVATIKLKGTKEGTGSVSVSNVRLARSGNQVGSTGGSTSFTITRAPVVPDAVNVSSSSHPDQNTSYTATSAVLAWNKQSGVTGFSYLLDDTADTTPPQAVTASDTSKTYDSLAVGTHYFHIRAVNGDGWGPTTHFKINVKEPDAQVDSSLTTPTITGIAKDTNATTDLNAGTVTGFTIKGTGGLAGFTTNLTLTPASPLPSILTTAVDTSVPQADGSTTTVSLTPLQVVPNSDGSWQVDITAPVPSGFYTVTAQDQKDKTLSPQSSPVKFELSVAQGGNVRMITDADATKPTSRLLVFGVSATARAVEAVVASLAAILVLIIAGGSLWLRRLHIKIKFPK